METGTVISIAAVVISFAALILNSKKETQSDAAAMASQDRNEPGNAEQRSK